MQVSVKPDFERRIVEPAPISLVELSPEMVVSGLHLPNGLLAPDPTPVATLREQCPHCKSSSLKLILRKDHVIRSHLFCVICTRCYDCVDANGRSELTPLAIPIY